MGDIGKVWGQKVQKNEFSWWGVSMLRHPMDAAASATRELDASASKGRQTQWLAWFQLEL